MYVYLTVRHVKAIGTQGLVKHRTNIASSTWSNAYKYQTESGRLFFVKTSRKHVDAMFRGEGEGLR